MRRPEKLKVLGKPYTVHYVNGEPLCEDEMGECDDGRQSLYIRDGQPLGNEQDTVLHEIIHAIDEQMQIRLKEDQVRRLATGLLAVLKDNPRLATYLKYKGQNAYPAPV